MNVPPQRVGEKGYVLPLVAVTVACLSLALAYAISAQLAATTSLRKAQQTLEVALASQDVAARTVFTLLTEPLSPGAIMVGADPGAEAPASRDDLVRSASGETVRPLALDGQIYITGVAGQTDESPGARAVLVSMQDEAGLLPLNAVDDEALTALLVELGLASSVAQTLAASLGDYIDPDDLSRVGGAEQGDYEQVGRARPPNRPIRSLGECFRVLGWSGSLTRAQQTSFFNLTSAGSSEGRLNINTAPPAVLEAVLRNPRLVESVEQTRRQVWIRDVSQIESLTGVATKAGGVVLAASVGNVFKLRVGLIAGRKPLVQWTEMEIELGGQGADRPFYSKPRFRSYAPSALREGQTRELNFEHLPESSLLPVA